MSAISDYLEAKIINHVLRNTAYTSPGTSIYVALHTASPTDAGGGAEVSGGSYARQQVTAWDAPGATDGHTQNTNAIVFPTATASWGTVTHVGIWDAVSGGNLLFHGALDASKVVDTDDVFQFAAGALDVTIA